MKLAPALNQAKIIKRYKRFLADIELPNGDVITIHCPNTGSMKACVVPGSACWFSRSDNPKRKYPFTWEVATADSGALVGINTHRANALVVEAIETGVVEALRGYETLRTEVKYGEQNSRIDILLQSEGLPECYVEVKNVTLENGTGEHCIFPDAVTDRGAKHLEELMHMRQQGCRAVLFFCVQHSRAKAVGVADEIDPRYGQLLRQAIAEGVEVMAYGADLSDSEIVLSRQLPLEL